MREIPEFSIVGYEKRGYEWQLGGPAGTCLGKSFRLFSTVKRCEAAIERLQRRMGMGSIRINYPYDWKRREQPPQRHFASA